MTPGGSGGHGTSPCRSKGLKRGAGTAGPALVSQGGPRSHGSFLQTPASVSSECGMPAPQLPSEGQEARQGGPEERVTGPTLPGGPGPSPRLVPPPRSTVLLLPPRHPHYTPPPHHSLTHRSHGPLHRSSPCRAWQAIIVLAPLGSQAIGTQFGKGASSVLSLLPFAVPGRGLGGPFHPAAPPPGGARPRSWRRGSPARRLPSPGPVVRALSGFPHVLSGLPVASVGVLVQVLRELPWDGYAEFP